MNQSPPLTKTCSICGKLKPLSAFVQLAGPQGATYSNVCSSCRKRAQEPTKKEPDERTTTSSGDKIDAKAKVHSEVEKRQHFKHINELYREQRKKKTTLKTRELDKLKRIAAIEKGQRESFLSRTKPYQSGAKTTAAESKEKTAVKVSEKQAQTAKEEKIIKTIAEEKRKIASFDFSVAYIAPQIPGGIKFQSVVLKQFQALLGDAPFMRVLGAIQNKPGAIIADSAKKAEGSKAEKGEATKEKDLADYISNNWSPTRRR